VITFAGYTWRNRLMRGEWREIDVCLAPDDHQDMAGTCTAASP
jgi:hypothetical protein